MPRLSADNAGKRCAETATKLEQNLSTVFGLKAKGLQLAVALLVVAFPFSFFLLLELEDFLERRLSQVRRDLVFLVEVLRVP